MTWQRLLCVVELAYTLRSHLSAVNILLYSEFIVIKPFSQACENNKHPIANVLTRVFSDSQLVLEVASGTGQHAVYFSQQMPYLTWQTSDLPMNHAGIEAWLASADTANLLPPLTLDVTQQPWPDVACDALFTANSLHIMPWQAVEALFGQLEGYLSIGAILAVYGPFNYGGNYTSASNQQFDEWLYAQSPHSAIRDFEEVNSLAKDAGFDLLEDNEMPANNRLIVWKKLF